MGCAGLFYDLFSFKPLFQDEFNWIIIFRGDCGKIDLCLIPTNPLVMVLTTTHIWLFRIMPMIDLIVPLFT
jgi:hypothetical protein